MAVDKQKATKRGKRPLEIRMDFIKQANFNG